MRNHSTLTTLVRSVALAALPLVLSAHTAAAQTAGEFPFEEFHLDNGLHVILAPDGNSTAVAVNLWYDAGSRNEPPGRSGFAHLFEHLMFQGSENVEAGAHFQLVERAGGSLNASITEDRTNFFQTVPSDRMNLALWLESDRMRSLRITAETLDREVEVVKEERRERFDNAPYGSSQLQAAYYAAYDSATCFAYAHSVIGSMEDLDAAELSDVQEFFDLYYTPNNATLTVVGAFDAHEARTLVEEYFGGIPRGADPAASRCEGPFSHLPVEHEIPDSNAQLPALWISYGIVERDHPDAPALGVLGQILGAGQSSRLNLRLVREEQAALQASSSSIPRVGPGILQVIAVANQGVEAGRLLELVDEEIDRIREEGVTGSELERARNQVRSGVIFSRQTVMGRAEALQSANHFYGTPAAIVTMVTAVEAVTSDDVRRVAREYLHPDNRAVIFTRPGGEEEDR